MCWYFLFSPRHRMYAVELFRLCGRYDGLPSRIIVQTRRSLEICDKTRTASVNHLAKTSNTYFLDSLQRSISGVCAFAAA